MLVAPGFFSLCLAWQAVEPAKPHVLLVILDDVAAVDLAGLPTPNLDRLAQHGVSFDVACASPTCDRTRRSLVFGEWWIRPSGSSCGPLGGNEPPLSLRSLAELLPLAPSAIAGKWHLGSDPSGGPWECSPEVHGFDQWLAGSPGNVENCGGFGYSTWTRAEACQSYLSGEYEPRAVTDSLRWWWRVTRGPKLGIFSANLAHSPFHVPPADLLPPGYVVGTSNREQYLAMIVAYDTLIGQVLEVVNPNTTLVIVIGDNGTPPNAGGGPKSKGTVYERGIRVPLTVSAAWIKPGRSDALVHAVDVYATIADYLDAPASGAGISLRPALSRQPFAGHDYVLCGNSDEVCARSAGYKLRRELAIGWEEFYDLTADPGETNDLIGDPAYRALAASHRAWLDANIP